MGSSKSPSDNVVVRNTSLLISNDKMSGKKSGSSPILALQENIPFVYALK